MVNVLQLLHGPGLRGAYTHQDHPAKKLRSNESKVNYSNNRVVTKPLYSRKKYNYLQGKQEEPVDNCENVYGVW